MTISIWRYSHLFLAVFSAIFIFITTITGIVLAFEPVSNKMQPYAVSNANELSIAKTLQTLLNEYDEVLTIHIDKNSFVEASVITKQGKNETFYINPFTGKKIGDLIKKKPVFEFATNLHRSLFLKSTGRFLVGLFSFFLFLITITGIKLVLKRQGGFKRFFSKVIKEDFEQYYHVLLGRYALIPIAIITLTGIYLSLEKFDLLPSDKLIHTVLDYNSNSKAIKIQDFEIFKSTSLDQLKTLEFPFSEDEEDYFILNLSNKELYINQYTGNIVSIGEKPLVALVSNASMILHTGQGTIIWALILLVSCFAILFFMYSGFTITLKRKKDTTKIKNKYHKDEVDYVILIGSETGHSQRFAKQFFEAFCAENYTVYIDQLNNYSTYKQVKHLIVFTSTYGEGEAPSNAIKFEKLLESVKQEQQIKYSVVGFGSLMYPDFCKYAILVDALLEKHPQFVRNLPLIKINNQSFDAFKSWVKQWNDCIGQDLKIQLTKPVVNRKRLKDFKVVYNSGCNSDDTFLLQLKLSKKLKFQSGDLLAFYPEEDNIERLYSVGKIDNTILLSVKRHELGVCSKQLSILEQNSMIKANIKRNIDFHFPDYAEEVIMIANGTGIAPFLGMINENTIDIKTHLFWGGRTQESFQLYSELIDKALKAEYLNSFHMAYSQEQEHKVYVQDLLKEEQDMVCNVLNKEGVIMICGSVAMQNGVLDILDTITKAKLKQPLSVFENNEQIKTDCY
ncbi:PepSY domain-containing protein [Winogradskyella sp.]|jgi:sulfite reductase (NADPH) flavoprotein alpha-component|uniref:PepSY domain-containing protein n=1 Tax=Winogradskyella sp. TaxID=1883156 RepID=UPI0025E5A5E4|nr:PepSY domain-containing protein [Winogradskyella sp.]MCT4628623.1 PepSY domain-containing protein [Winogradskyella sp.]